MQSGPTRRTVRPLSVRTAGGIRTRDLTHSQYVALSAELQRYASKRYRFLDMQNLMAYIVVDKYQMLLFDRIVNAAQQLQ